MNTKSRNKRSDALESVARRRGGLQRWIEHVKRVHAKHLPAYEVLVELDALIDATTAVRPVTTSVCAAPSKSQSGWRRTTFAQFNSPQSLLVHLRCSFLSSRRCSSSSLAPTRRSCCCALRVRCLKRALERGDLVGERVPLAVVALQLLLHLSEQHVHPL